MPEEKRETTQGDKSVYVEKGDVKIIYPSGKQINKCLGILPLNPVLFLGRKNELKEVHDKLFAGNNLLLLVNGEGGIGKTTFASKYYHTYHNEYTHIAWIVAEKSLHEAILTLAFPLQVTFPDSMRENERLQTLLCEMDGLQMPCLLVIDNANSLEDLESHCLLLNRGKNFHLLLTTRITQFEHPEIHHAFHAINHLDEEYAIQLFKAHYPAYSPVEDELLRQILEAVGYNTLVIELLAKNLGNFNNKLRQRYTLSDLLSDLQKKGLFGLSQSGTISIAYHGDGLGLRKEKPEAILAAMYNLTELEEAEKTMLSVFAVLPAEPISFTSLEELLPGTDNLDITLLNLAKKGWLEFNNTPNSFKCSPVVQEVTRLQNREKLFEHCTLLIATLIEKLEYDPGSTGHLRNVTYEIGAVYVRYAENILNLLEKRYLYISVLLEKVGAFHKTKGNFSKALTCFTESYRLTKKLYTAYPKRVNLKYSLAICCEKLGRLHVDLRNLDKALNFYDELSRLSKELFDADQQNVDFKKELAVSYLQLGIIHLNLGNLDKSFIFLGEQSRLCTELCETYPQDLDFKDGLATSYERLGETYTALGDFDKALTSFNLDFKLTKELSETDSKNPVFKDGLATSYEKLGETYTALGDFDKALTFFEICSRLRKELYEAYPQNANYKHSLAVSYRIITKTHGSLGSIDKCSAFIELNAQLSRELYEAFPENVIYKQEFANSCTNRGILTQAKNGDSAITRNYFEQAEALWAGLVKSYPAYAEFQRNWSLVKNILNTL